MLGVVNLDKPVGPTSHDMVNLLRRLTGTRRIGHAGTLDPLASGVLPILVGAATRFSEELTGGRKRYEALIRLGERSATDDAQGPIEPTGAPLPSEEAIIEAVAGLVGTFEQRPPNFSARKLAGRTAHRSARAGEPIELPARVVTVDAAEVLALSRGDATADVRVDLRCGPGTYVRSIARDLGEELGCGGHLQALRRTEAAGLRAEDAVTPSDLERLADAGRLSDAILAVDQLLPLPVVALSSEAAWRFVHGSKQALDGAQDSARVKVFDADERLLGVGSVTGGELRPEKVLPLEPGQ
ncbi:MAG TPA: tRNA pseudouridine(55) synthase TruB [Candidatus Limnocylindria bacterium]|nr:tRNA pseudouridine(55) synthase TruB [Candidatus Limnocylindria bacterium]